MELSIGDKVRDVHGEIHEVIELEPIWKTSMGNGPLRANLKRESDGLIQFVRAGWMYDYGYVKLSDDEPSKEVDMFEIRVFDGGTVPWATTQKEKESDAIELAKALVKGEDLTWRAEVWSPEGRMVYLAQPSADKK